MQKIYYHKTIFQFDLYLKQKNYLWNSDFIMTLNSRLHNDEVLSRSMKIYYTARNKKISSTLFFFLQFTKINYQQSDKWSFYLLLPFLLSKRISMLLMTSSEEYRRQRMTNIKNEFQKCMHIKLTPNCEEYLSNLEAL